MGLDMYLTKKIYVGANYDFNKISGIIDLKIDEKPIKIDLSKVTYIEEKAGYWREANQVHKWFVDNIQHGNDDCKEYYVDYEDLVNLLVICREIIKTKSKKERIKIAKKQLPTFKGFFFGSYEYDKGYFDDLKYTIRTIANLEPNCDYCYKSNW